MFPFPKLPFKGIIALLVGYISNVINMFAPSDLTPEAKEQLEKIVGCLYAVAKFYGIDIVVASANDLDNVALKELIEVCEMAKDKYGLCLDASKMEWPAIV